MAITSTVSPDGRSLTLHIQGRVALTVHREFRGWHEQLDEAPEFYQIDMKNADHLDRSALGMLLRLRDHAGGDNAKIEIINCSADVKKILTISNFEQLFEIK